ncbi:uncharacterized protein LACBIDRAFT_321947 [Laccaria bicolor S238N-H82]|uniref:Predicted protein n=1 Tax=Laccaria bicolor (strain S238N-H82 / ATCC MYA-4686) TaxID=486041 RepID=B0CUQ9_LACBS|nr:uncharacterized protein LACBIDRAFT_321947 [Laccaria bicolor S238N-H82]EDR14712.1 predicted protein [Laccaria bicolor S238N-H82]|eukprot:XP_001875271.1 predicted protein [Laccaria bicolor S238N-H82]
MSQSATCQLNEESLLWAQKHRICSPRIVDEGCKDIDCVNGIAVNGNGTLRYLHNHRNSSEQRGNNGLFPLAPRCPPLHLRSFFFQGSNLVLGASCRMFIRTKFIVTYVNGLTSTLCLISNSSPFACLSLPLSNTLLHQRRPSSPVNDVHTLSTSPFTYHSPFPTMTLLLSKMFSSGVISCSFLALRRVVL